MTKVDELEQKIGLAIDQLVAFRKDNVRLRAEVESLKGHVTLLSGENQKAQQVLAQYDRLRRVQEQVTQRVEHALSTLNNLRAANP